MDAFLTVLLGILVRIGLPVLASLGLFALLRALDRRWQEQARLLPVISPGQKPCWEVKGCPEQKKKNCEAARRPQVPCWQVFRTRDGRLRETCLGCALFRDAILPIRP